MEKSNSLQNLFYKYIVILGLIFLFTTGLKAQQGDSIYVRNIAESIDLKRPTNNAWMFGAGSTNMYDTYLSPLKYKGFHLHIYNERMRRTTWFNYRFYKQQFIELEFGMGDNPAKNASEYRLAIQYRLGGHYRIYETQKLKVGVGGLWTTHGGVLYNERNGNNPASAQVYTNIDLSANVSYNFGKFAARWQLDTPVIGMMFSPRYGQSYYEISLGNSVGVVNFASIHNQRALRSYLTVDIPINKVILRVGYQASLYQTKVNSIVAHNYTHNFVFGFPIEGFFKKKMKTKNVYWQ